MAKSIPDDWLVLMDANDKRTGLPPGTTYGIVKTETGFQDRFINDPAAAHYSGANPKSSAAGLGGILRDTAAKPGYGVTPLKDWTVPEQLRFISDYAAARIKQAGSVEAGLAGYGEGKTYAQKVMGGVGKVNSRVPEQAQDVVGPVQLAQAPTPTTVAYRDVAPSNAPVPIGYTAPDPEGWGEFQQAMAQQEPVRVADLNFGGFSGGQADFRPQVSTRSIKPNFKPFGKWQGKV